MTLRKATREALAELIDSERRTQALYDVVALHFGAESLTKSDVATIEDEIDACLRRLDAPTRKVPNASP